MVDFTTQSGAKVKINPADWKSANALKTAVTKELSAAEFDLKFDMSKDFTEQDINLLDFAKLALSVDSSEAVYKAIFSCLVRCTYNGHRITEETFEDVEARGDYYEIVIACLKENLLPFFKGLVSKLKPLADLLPKADQTAQDQK